MDQESLLHIPLVGQMLNDPHLRLESRQVDQRWFYEGVIPMSVTGFNHFSNRVFYSSRSFFAQWLAAPERSARPLNESDLLLREVLFAVHDYLHVWSLQMLNRLVPELGIGTAPITRDNVEDFVFCHLLTEAAATVGLDYWYLSTLDLNDVVPIGTTMEALTVSYHERHAAEYRRHSPSFSVQSSGFFSELCRFYCDGVFRGFDVQDVKRSPQVLKWLRHELQYGVVQRKNIRLWLSYIGGQDLYAEDALGGRVDLSAPWKKRVMDEVGEALWAKVKHGQSGSAGVALDEDALWKSPLDRRPDFRFLNASQVVPEQAHGIPRWEQPARNFQFYFSQLLSSFEYDKFEPRLKELLPSLRRDQNPALAQKMLQDQPRLPAKPECRDLLILN